MKHIILKTKNYILYFEYVLQDNLEEIIVAHCDVFKWNKNIKQELINKFYNIFVVQEMPLYVVLNKENNKLIKFSVMNGFIPYKSNVTTQSGEVKEMFKWIGSK